MKTGIIYLVTNKVNGKKYIGQTYVQLPYRKRRHFKSAFVYGSNLQFHQALRKYGKESFIWDIIETTDISLLDEREIYWVSYHDSFNNGYNMNEGGGSSRGYHHTEETKNKIRNSMKGRSNLDHWVDRYGKEKGINVYNEYIKNLKKRKGKKKIDYMIEKYGEIEGTRRYHEFVEKIRNSRKGTKLSEDHKKKIGIGQRKFHENKKGET
jgi:group I intron endonuclease